MKRNTPEEFKASMSFTEPPEGLSEYLKALWYAGKDEWESAHNIVQEMNDRHSAHIHAYLHRKEGDLSNAGYWYDRAGSRMPSVSLDKEWEVLVAFFLDNN